MDRQDPYRQLTQALQVAVGALELPDDDVCKQEVLALDQPTRLRIAVFGPFNYGKSTLLNALLGEKALPMDLIPTTGAAIGIRYGPELQTRIQLACGEVITQAGTDILQDYAILDDQRRMRAEVAAVDIACPHPFYKQG